MQRNLTKKGKEINSSYSKCLLPILASVLAWMLMHLLFLSCRKYTFGLSELKQHIQDNAGKAVSASWHRSMFYTVFFFRNLNASLMASRSRDGEFLTALLKRFGYVVPRGSSGASKRGQEALEEFIAHVNNGNVGGLAVDGPQGPPYVAKNGICVAAARTGAPILPHIWYAESNIRVKSWDRTIIPKPFSKLVMIIDRKPIYFTVKDVNEQIEACRQIVTTRLNSLTYQADHWFMLRDKYPDPRDIPVPSPVPTPNHPSPI